MLTIATNLYMSAGNKANWGLPAVVSADGLTVTMYQAGDTLPDLYLSANSGLTQNQLDVKNALAIPQLQALIAMTPAQVQAWVTANVTNLAGAQQAIYYLGVAVSILGRTLQQIK